MGPGPLARRSERRVLGGVADGLAAWLDLPLWSVRVGLLVLATADGAGLVAYGVLWLFLPQAAGEPRSTEPLRRLGALALAGLVVVTAVVISPLDVVPGGTAGAALAAAVAGVALVWQQADAAQRDRWRTTATRTPGGLVRLVVGAALLVAGAVGFLASRGQLANARAGLLSTVVVVGGLALLSSPWWLGMTSDLRAERTARIRSQERAEVAAHLHDSVLQTLALIQRSAGAPGEVTRLARSQERALRQWLYQERHDATTLAAALELSAAEVEEALAVPVEVVVVGDCPTDERVDALVAATREAVVNAARHSGAASVDVYAEVEPSLVSVFVRDRGRGFDPVAVPDDRHGIAGSVVGRMARHGGTAVIRSEPGAGTEVRLELPRS